MVQIPADKGRAKPIFIVTDSLGYNEKTVGEARLLPVWRSEQPPYQKFGHEFITSKIRQKADQNKPLVSVDVGCGSGISSLWLPSFCDVYPELQVRNIGIDLSPRAIKASEKNTKLNGYQDDQIDWVLEEYNSNSVSPNSADVIFLNPPFNPRPTSFADTLTPHADGWNEQATANFENQLNLAIGHLSPEGIILINQMLPIQTTLDNPFAEYFDKYGDINVNYLDVYPPIDAKEFLDGAYPQNLAALLSDSDKQEIQDFKQRILEQYSHFSYNIFVVQKQPANSTGRPTGYINRGIFQSNMFDHGNWQDRIDLHKGINTGMIKRRVKTPSYK